MASQFTPKFESKEDSGLRWEIKAVEKLSQLFTTIIKCCEKSNFIWKRAGKEMHRQREIDERISLQNSFY